MSGSIYITRAAAGYLSRIADALELLTERLKPAPPAPPVPRELTPVVAVEALDGLPDADGRSPASDLRDDRWEPPLKGGRQHRALVNGWEVDAFTKWRHIYSWGPGVRKYIKRRANRRLRQQERQGRGND